MTHRFLISQDSPVLFITIVTHYRLPVFQTDPMREILCRALDEARRSGGFLQFAYVIVLDHMLAEPCCESWNECRTDKTPQ